jgi:hypothetical protein
LVQQFGSSTFTILLARDCLIGGRTISLFEN